MKYWYEKNLRMLQTVLREVDAINYDAQGVVDYMKSIGANCLVMNAGGVIDFFDNPLPLSKVNRYLNGQNILKDLCDKLHKENMRIIVRVDFRGVELERFKQHPEWFAIGPDGKHIYSESRNCYMPCYNSYYSNGHAVEFIKYLFENYDLDGIWENAVTFGRNACYCDTCREKYRRDTGKEIPIPSVPDMPGGEDMFDEYMKPAFDEYRAWKSKCADEHIELLKRTVKSFGEDKAYCAEIFGVYSGDIHIIKASGIDYINGKNHFDFLVNCATVDWPLGKGYKAYDSVYTGGSTVRFNRALDSKKQPVINSSGMGAVNRHVKAPSQEVRLWFWEIVSMGGGIWFCYFNCQHPGLTPDRRGSYSIKDAFRYLSENSELLAESEPVRDVAIFYSGATKSLLADPDEGKDQFGIHIMGMERVLIEKHIPYGFVVGGEEFNLESLTGVKTLLLPNVAAMSDSEADVIREFVSRGGGVVATYQSSLFYADGKPREDYALADLFGCSYACESVSTEMECYFAITSGQSPVLGGITDTTLLLNGGNTVLCKAKQGSEVACYVPRIHGQPPEYVVSDSELHSDYSGIVTNHYGKGKVVYFANTIDGLCISNGHEDFTEVLGNAIDFVSDKKYLVTTDAYRSVHVNVIRTNHGYIVSFINTSGTSARPIKELVPVGEFKVALNKNGMKFVGMKCIWGDGMTAQETENQVVITVNGLQEFKSVQVDFG